MKESVFLSSSEAKERYDQIIPVYQKAFAGGPWFEKSKCVAPKGFIGRCQSGFSSLAVGSLCNNCELCTKEAAYPAEELANKFNFVGQSRPTAWYTEELPEGLSLAAYAWVATSAQIVMEKYSENQEMRQFLESLFQEKVIVWLDEIFANLEISPTGNLKNFGTAVRGLAVKLGFDTVAFRTINERLISAARRDFGQSVQVFTPNDGMPDWRSFVVIKL